jgi:hypothetical protein
VCSHARAGAPALPEEEDVYRAVVFGGLPVDPAVYRRIVFGAGTEAQALRRPDDTRL